MTYFRQQSDSIIPFVIINFIIIIDLHTFLFSSKHALTLHYLINS
jgi:hypothetical protein